MKSLKYLVIPAAGQGTRMKSVNSQLPKELLPVFNKPLLLYIIEEGIAAGINNILIIINRDKDIIKHFLEDKNVTEQWYKNCLRDIQNLNNKCNIKFLYQDSGKGEIAAISTAADIIGNDAFAVIYPDELHYPFKKTLKSLCEKFILYDKDIIGLVAIGEHNASLTGNSGKVELEKFDKQMYYIQKFLQKTRETQFQLRYKKELRVCGYMIYNDDTFKYVNKVTSQNYAEHTDIDLRTAMLEDNRQILGYEFDDFFFDLGNPDGYYACNTFLNSLEQK